MRPCATTIPCCSCVLPSAWWITTGPSSSESGCGVVARTDVMDEMGAAQSISPADSVDILQITKAVPVRVPISRRVVAEWEEAWNTLVLIKVDEKQPREDKRPDAKCYLCNLLKKTSHAGLLCPHDG